MVVKEVKSREAVASAPITVGKVVLPPRSSEHSQEDQLLSEIGTARREALWASCSHRDRVVWCFWDPCHPCRRAAWPGAFLLEACCTGPQPASPAGALRCNQGSPCALEPLLHCKRSCSEQPLHSNRRVTLPAATAAAVAWPSTPKIKSQ